MTVNDTTYYETAAGHRLVVREDFSVVAQIGQEIRQFDDPAGYRSLMGDRTEWRVIEDAGLVAFLAQLFSTPEQRPPQTTPEQRPTDPEVTGGADRSWKWKLALVLSVLVAGRLIAFAFSIACLIFMYGIVVLVFRHAFGIELPFGRFN